MIPLPLLALALALIPMLLYVHAHPTDVYRALHVTFSMSNVPMKCTCKCRAEETQLTGPFNATVFQCRPTDPYQPTNIAPPLQKWCACMLRTCLCEKAVQYQHLERRHGDGSLCPVKWPAVKTDQRFLDTAHRQYQVIAEGTNIPGISRGSHNILRKLHALVKNQNPDAKLSSENIQKLLADATSSDLILVLTASSIEPIHPDVQKHLPKSANGKPRNVILEASMKELIKRMEKRGIQGFRTDELPASKQVLNVFRGMHPEMKDLQVRVAHDEDALAEAVLQNLDLKGDWAVVYENGGAHKNVIFGHRGSGSEPINAIFVLDSLGNSRVSALSRSDFMDHPDVSDRIKDDGFQVYSFVTQRQVSESGCLVCSLEDMAAVKRYGSENLGKFAKELAVSSPLLPDAVPVLPGEFLLHTESLSFLKIMDTFGRRMRAIDGDLATKFERTFRDLRIAILLEKPPPQMSSISVQNLKGFHQAYKNLAEKYKKDRDRLNRALAQLERTLIVGDGGKSPLELVQNEFEHAGANRLTTITSMRIYASMLMSP